MIDNNVNEKWISIDDAAEHLGVKPVTIRDWIRKGKDIPAHTYTHLGLDDAKNEMIRMEELEQARKEVDKAEGKKPMKQNMFKVV